MRARKSFSNFGGAATASVVVGGFDLIGFAMRWILSKHSSSGELRIETFAENLRLADIAKFIHRNFDRNHGDTLPFGSKGGNSFFR